MKMIMKKRIGLSLTVLAGSALIISCSSGDTDGGAADDKAESYYDDTFVAEDGTVGRIEVEVLEPELQVALTSGFFVSVFDASGAPVPNLKISCDSEQGIAIVEPTTGIEITDSGGKISGRIGCEVPGSYQFGCRLPVGGNRRKFVDVICRGPIPNGFTGFPGAAGGGLGTGGSGGAQDGGVGGVNPDGVRITNIAISDTGATNATSTTSIDTTLSDCDADPTTFTAEPFFDTVATFKVVNNSNLNIRFNSLRYTVPNASGTGSSSFTSSSIGLIGEAAPNGGESTFSNILIFDASGLGKRFQGASANIPTSLGFRNITFALTGTTDLGDEVTITGTQALSFDGYNNCAG
jgi:hypothetical protein